MKKNVVDVLLVLAGLSVGYYVGIKWDAKGWELIYEILSGAIFGLSVAFGLSEKDKGIFIGAVVGLGICLSLDWFAGSPIYMRDKLSYMSAAGFVGWGFWVYRKQVLSGGLVGAVIGFLFGLQKSHFFGAICLPPGLLNATLFSVQMFILGMLFASLYMKYYGWRFMVTNE